MSRTITDHDDIRPGDTVTVRVTDVGSSTDNGHMDYEVVSVEREVPEWEPGMAGTATINGVPGARVLRCDFPEVLGWVTTDGCRYPDDEVDDFVPDDVEELRGRLAGSRAGVEKLRKNLEAEQRGRNALAAGLEAERDEALAEVERLRAARTLPTREQVERTISDVLSITSYSKASYALTTHLAPSILALFEQGGAAPKVTRAEFTAAVNAVHPTTVLAVMSVARIAKDLLDNLGIEVAE